MIEGLTKEVEVGAIYTGKVTRVTNFGAFVEVLPKKEGLVHISELADYRVAKVEDVVKEGDEITVKVTEIDHLGRMNLSRKAVFGDSSQEKPSRPAGSDSANRPHSRPSRPRPGMHRSYEQGYPTSPSHEQINRYQQKLSALVRAFRIRR